MPFEQNDNRINRNGRPKGSPDKVSAQIREQFRKLVEGNFDQLEADFAKLKAKDRIEMILRMSAFLLPKLQSIEMKEYPEYVELLMMPVEDRRRYLAELKKELNGKEGKKGDD